MRTEPALIHQLDIKNNTKHARTHTEKRIYIHTDGEGESEVELLMYRGGGWWKVLDRRGGGWNIDKSEG